MTDPVADMFSRLRNGLAVRQLEIELPYSKFKHEIAKILVDNNYLPKVSVNAEGVAKRLVLSLQTDTEPAEIEHIKRLSRPGRRQYVDAADIPLIKRGRGMIIISTPKGLMNGQQAKNQKLGGELICEVY